MVVVMLWLMQLNGVGEPDMVFHAVLRYPSGRNRKQDHIIPVRKLSMALRWAGWHLGNCYENEKKNWLYLFKMEPDWIGGMTLFVKLHDIGLKTRLFFIPVDCAFVFHGKEGIGHMRQVCLSIPCSGTDGTTFSIIVNCEMKRRKK